MNAPGYGNWFYHMFIPEKPLGNRMLPCRYATGRRNKHLPPFSKLNGRQQLVHPCTLLERTGCEPANLLQEVKIRFAIQNILFLRVRSSGKSLLAHRVLLLHDTFHGASGWYHMIIPEKRSEARSRTPGEDVHGWTSTAIRNKFLHRLATTALEWRLWVCKGIGRSKSPCI